jgi:AcrR family transcriptional regulator
MNKTKIRILQACIELYNNHGISNVTFRKIADHLSMSPGNLTYHFKKKEDINIALYQMLVERMDEAMAQNDESDLGIESMLVFTEFMFDTMYSYRFFFIDFVQIIRTHQSIKSHYLNLQNQRKEAFIKIFQTLEKNGILKKEELSDEYLRLYDRLQIFTDFYFSTLEISAKPIANSKKDYIRSVIYMIYPYLTTEAKKYFP